MRERERERERPLVPPAIVIASELLAGALQGLTGARRASIGLASVHLQMWGARAIHVGA